jgi:hypothetical protein
VLALRFGARLKGPEIANVLDLSGNGVRRLLSRGLRSLRTELERGGRAGPADRGSAAARLPGDDHERRDHEQGEA